MSEKKEKEKNRENIMPKKSCQIKKKNKTADDLLINLCSPEISIFVLSNFVCDKSNFY